MFNLFKKKKDKSMTNDETNNNAPEGENVNVTADDVGTVNEVLGETAEQPPVEGEGAETTADEDTQPTTDETDETDETVEKEEEVVDEKPMTVEEAINAAANLAAKLPAHAGKSAAQHGTDIAASIRDMLKKK